MGLSVSAEGSDTANLDSSFGHFTTEAGEPSEAGNQNGADVSSSGAATRTGLTSQAETSTPAHSVPAEPDAILYRVGPGPSLSSPKPQFERRLGQVGPFLQLRRERLKLPFYGPNAPALIYVMVENIADFPVTLMPTAKGRFMDAGGEEMPSTMLEPGEVHKLTRLSTDEERYRMDCYATGLPHFPCNGISKRVDPTTIVLACQPAARDLEGWYAMAASDGVVRPEAWVISIDCVEQMNTISVSLKYELMQTCEFSDERRPMKRVSIPLADIRYCQDSCGQTFRDGRTLESTVQELKQGETTTAELGIRIVDFGGVYFALDNRRLKCAKLAFPQKSHPDKLIAALLADLGNPVVKQEWELKFTAGRSILPHREGREEKCIDKSSQAQAAPQHGKHSQQKQTGGPGDLEPEKRRSQAGLSSLQCSQCHQLLPRESFSSAQQKKKAARRCQGCVRG